MMSERVCINVPIAEGCSLDVQLMAALENVLNHAQFAAMSADEQRPAVDWLHTKYGRNKP